MKYIFILCLQHAAKMLLRSPFQNVWKEMKSRQVLGGLRGQNETPSGDCFLPEVFQRPLWKT